MDADTTGPTLEGVRVLDLTQYLAGPACTRMLAEMGAEVIKVEAAPFGDPSRAFTPRRNRRAGFFVQQHRGKQSVCLDLRSDAGIAVVRALADEVDVVVENFSPGVMDRKGWGYAELASTNPGLIMASVSGFGQTGPLRDKPAFDFVAQAYGGVMHMTGDPDGPPTFVGIGLADTGAGVHAFGAIGMALFHRERTGKGCHIDASMVDSLVHLHETGIYAPSITGPFGDDPTAEPYVPMRAGRHYQPSAPGAGYRSPEGWIVVFCTQGQIDGLWRALGRPELGDDERFRTNDGRLAHRDELTALIEDWMATFDTDAAVLAALDAERVPCSRVLSPAEFVDEPHLVERGMIREVVDPVAGPVTIPGFPLAFDGDRPAAAGPAPTLGQHNHQVLGGLLGYDDARISAMEADGVLASKPR
ncbi:CaiB/BaiF CoA transferase family protein [Actinospongicola halichondriae]|uniref:CaiB/BaiF CoA transferase family protein n=1 Tax=Actinospongicola halichondriae TaxID=3236844 RepID=UPI003D497163